VERPSLTESALPTPQNEPDGVVRLSLPTVSVGDAWDKIRLIQDKSIDCVVTSPPYWGLRSYGQRHDDSLLARWAAAHPEMDSNDLRLHPPGYEWYRANGGVLGLEPYPDWYVAHLVAIFERLRPKLKPSASVWVNLGDTFFARWSSMRSDGRQGLGSSERTRRVTPAVGYLHDKQALLIPARFAIAMQDGKWIVRNDVIWAKTAVPPRPEKDRLRLSHEHLFHFVQRSKSGRPTYYYDIDGAEDGARDVVTVSTRAGRDGHSATFPMALIEPRIASSCPPGGLVVDPFCGTGSTLEAAIRLGRRAHGIELSPTYAAAARKNVKNVRPIVPAHQQSSRDDK
jgi:site-specific DNA-methyltransferase (cytosine-N4-specific)